MTRVINMGLLLLSMLGFLCPIHAAQLCGEQKVTLQVLGSGGPEIDDGRASSSYLIWLDGQARVLVDVGPGSSINFGQSGASIEDIDVIALTHLHVDHSADLASFIKGSFFSERHHDLVVIGPEQNSLMPATSQFVNAMFNQQGVYPYLQSYILPSKENAYHIVSKDVPIQHHNVSDYQLNETLQLQAIAVHHGPVAAVAWRVNLAGCAITFSGDMNNDYRTLAKLAADTDILVMHNAIPEGTHGVAARLHMTPSQIGLIAQQAAAKKVVVSHRMRRTLGKEDETLRYIRQSYTGPVIFADDLDSFDLNVAK